MDTDDIRWKQRFSSYQSAFRQLKDAVQLSKERGLSLLEKQGLIQAFEFTHEMAWNVIKDFVEYQGNFSVKGSRDATKEGFNLGLLNNGKIWMEMIQSRNITSHLYDEKTSEAIAEKIIKEYHTEFVEFEKTITRMIDERQ